jgi:hypothetical protein
MYEHTLTIDDLVNNVSISRPHVVLLGAGASRAAFPNGGKNGKKLPLMDDFIDTVPIKHILDKLGIKYSNRNFEDVYSELSGNPVNQENLQEIEKIIFNYFSSLELPSAPTIYDHLVLGLRPKDVIATFNWDPFLIQAAIRNSHIGGLPKLLFLHGNVLSGFCKKNKVHGMVNESCSKCGELFEPTPLLYPIQSKNYDSFPAINSFWEAAKWAFANAFMVTVFGYGAPSSDILAMDLLKNAWKTRGNREFEEFEIIDIREEKSLIQSWKEFIFSHHYRVKRSILDSWIYTQPRRTGEAWWAQFLNAKWITPNRVPLFDRLEDLWEWYAPLIDKEN